MQALFLLSVHVIVQNPLRINSVLPHSFIALILNLIELFIKDTAWICGSVRQLLNSVSKTYLMGDVEAFIWVAERVRPFESLFPGHASVHTNLQGITKYPQ